MKKYQAVLSAVILLVSVGISAAMMGGGPGNFGPGTINGGNFGMMNGGASMMTNGGNFGMMNGAAGTPIVGTDGSAYFISTARTTDTSATPSSNSFVSNVLAVSPSGNKSSLTLNGIVSRPVVEGNLLVATASLPNFSNYHMIGYDGVNGINPTPGQSILYAVTLPWSESTKPVAISMDGGFASVPVVSNNHIYVTTSDYGNAMMGNAAFNMMNGNYNLNGTGPAKTYLYIFNLDGSLASKTVVE